jgi:hypothetical protein
MKTFTATQIDNNLVEVVIKGFDGTLRDMIFKTTVAAMTEAVEKYNKGALIQEAFHFLTAAEREFLISGITPAEWDRLFAHDKKEEPDDDDDW